MLLQSNPQLSKLVLVADPSVHELFLQEALVHCQSLTYLSLDDQWIPRRTVHDVSRAPKNLLPLAKLPLLNSLHLNLSFLSTAALPELFSVATFCQQLREFSILITDDVVLTELTSVLDRFTNLQVLCLNSFRRQSNHSLIAPTRSQWQSFFSSLSFIPLQQLQLRTYTAGHAGSVPAYASLDLKLFQQAVSSLPHLEFREFIPFCQHPQADIEIQKLLFLIRHFPLLPDSTCDTATPSEDVLKQQRFELHSMVLQHVTYSFFREDPAGIASTSFLQHQLLPAALNAVSELVTPTFLSLLKLHALDRPDCSPSATLAAECFHNIAALSFLQFPLRAQVLAFLTDPRLLDTVKSWLSNRNVFTDSFLELVYAMIHNSQQLCLDRFIRDEAFLKLLESYVGGDRYLREEHIMLSLCTLVEGANAEQHEILLLQHDFISPILLNIALVSSILHFF